MISMYSVFVFSNTFRLKWLSIFPTTITLSAIAIHGHFKQGLAVKISRYCLGWLFLRDKGHKRLPTPPVRIAWLNDSFPYIFFVVRWCSMFDVRCSCSMFDVRVDVRCSMFDVRCSIENAYVFYHPVDSRSTKSIL
jgi:hypothetical protein